MREVQSELIQQTQALLQQALDERDIDAVSMLGVLLEQLTRGYANLMNAHAPVGAFGGEPQRQGWGNKKGFASALNDSATLTRPQAVQIVRQNAPQRQLQAKPQPPQPQSYVYADGFQGVELPLGTDRDELPPEGDYWENTQG